MKGAIATVLLGKAGVTNLVGTRIYSEPWPQGATYPLLSIAQVSGLSEHHSGGSAGTADELWDITAAARTDYSAQQIAEAVRVAIDCATAVTWSGFSVRECLLETRTTLPPSDEGTGGQTGLHRVVLTFRVRRSEAAATP